MLHVGASYLQVGGGTPSCCSAWQHQQPLCPPETRWQTHSGQAMHAGGPSPCSALQQGCLGPWCLHLLMIVDGVSGPRQQCSMQQRERRCPLMQQQQLQAL